MSWNYRIIRYRSGDFGLVEVYYDKAGKPDMRTGLTSFAADADEGADDIIQSLEMALTDARKHPVLDDFVEKPDA